MIFKDSDGMIVQLIWYQIVHVHVVDLNWLQINMKLS
jgi:hypothetical protein